MVLFENLKVGSRVQTNRNGYILKGTVRYKGELITREGDWVGVELDEPGKIIASQWYQLKFTLLCNFFQFSIKNIYFLPFLLEHLLNYQQLTLNSWRY